METTAMKEEPPNGVGREAQGTNLAAGIRVAAAATTLTLLLAIVKGVFGHLRHSPALTADAVHSGADVLAIFASWVGLKLAQRPPTRRFPFGLYRAETLASLLVSAIILIAGIGLLIGSAWALLRGGSPLTHSAEVIVVAAVSAVLSFGIYTWEKRVGHQIHSQSLLANADESRIDILTSAAVFVGTFASFLGIGHLESLVAAGLSVLIIWLGAKHGRLAIFALLDASLDSELEQRAADVARQVQGVLGAPQVRLRRAGPFCFGIANIRVRKSIDVARAHELAHRVAKAVRDAIPQIETITVHQEPFQPEEQTVMVPADEDRMDAAVSEHFGRARFFLFATVSPRGIHNTQWIPNPWRGEMARAGLAVIRETLQSRRIDAVLTRQMGEISFHTLRDHYVDIYAAPEGTVADALARFAEKALSPLEQPTHVSKAAGAPSRSEEENV